MVVNKIMSCEDVADTSSPEPNPLRFHIVHIEQFPPFLVATVKYHGCTRYEGTKLLVFKDVLREDLESTTYLDPHFNGDKLSPIDRFNPNMEGRKLMNMLMYQNNSNE